MKKEPGLGGGSSLLGVKKPKLSQTFTPLGRPVDDRGRASPSTHIYHYDEIAKEGENLITSFVTLLALGSCKGSCAVHDDDNGMITEFVLPSSTPCGTRQTMFDNRKEITHHMFVAVDPNDLLDAIQDAESAGDDDKVEKLLCGAVKYLKMNRAKPNDTMVLTLMFLAKTKHGIFGSEVVIEVKDSSSMEWEPCFLYPLV